MDTITKPARAPGPDKGLPFLGQTLEVWRDMLGFFQRAANEYGNTVEFKFGPYVYVMVNEPEGIRHVLVDNHRNYKKSRNYDGLKLLLGEGLVTSEGDFWRRQRKLAQPAFHRERLAGFAVTMAAATKGMLERWERNVRGGSTVDVHGEMMRVTLDIVGQTLLSTPLDDEAHGIGEAMGVTLRYVNEYAVSLVRVPAWVPTPKNVRFARAAKTLDELVLAIIRQRRERPENAGTDLLSMFMAVRDEETREQMTDRQLKDEVMTMVTAGHETTANALSWTIYLLSKHPDVARRLHTEIADVLGPNGTPTLELLPKLTYCHAVLSESMRLFPPVWSFEREALADDVVSGFSIPKGAIVGIFPHILHRDPAHWPNPEGFDPDRFLSTSDRPRYAYLPFGAGPRTCIGNAFAMMEAQIILAMIVQHYRLELVPGASVIPEPVVTLRPLDGLPMKILPRVPVSASVARHAVALA
jgi:cytochrome P450